MIFWQQPCFALSADALEGLSHGRLAAIHLQGFATAQECQRLCHALRHCDIARRAATTSPMTLIGSNFSNFRGRDKGAYFATVEPAYRDLQTLTDAADFDPLQRWLETLASVWPGGVEIAREPGYGRYFAGGIKTRVQGSPLHFDYAPRFAADYRIGQVVDQLSWNLYLEMPLHTGTTTIYNAPVSRERAVSDKPVWDNRVAPEQVDGAQTYTFQPEPGELVVFNTRNPHTVAVDDVAPGEWRAQAGSFIGRLADNRLLLWS